MDIGFEITGAKPKGQSVDPPKQQPMRAGEKVRRNPSTDQRKVRRQLAKSAALEADITATGQARWVSRDEQVIATIDRQGASLAVFVVHPEGMERKVVGSVHEALEFAAAFDVEASAPNSDAAYEHFTSDPPSDVYEDYAHGTPDGIEYKQEPDPQWTTASRHTAWSGGEIIVEHSKMFDTWVVYRKDGETIAVVDTEDEALAIKAAQEGRVASRRTASKEGVAAALKAAYDAVVAMYFLAHGAHWNVEGPGFPEWHDKFAEVYEDVYGSLDPIAENMRKLGFPAPATTLGDSPAPEAPAGQDVQALLAALLGANGTVLEALNAAFAAATSANEQGIADFLAQRIDAHQTWAWQLGASAKTGARKTAGEDGFFEVDVETVEEGRGTWEVGYKSNWWAALKTVMDEGIPPSAILRVRNITTGFVTEGPQAHKVGSRHTALAPFPTATIEFNGQPYTVYAAPLGSRRTAGFWDDIHAQYEALKSAKSADDVLRICPKIPGMSAGDGFFEGSGGDEQVYDALLAAGWKIIWMEADYFWAMRAPNGDIISYVEGDLYRGDQQRTSSRRVAVGYDPGMNPGGNPHAMDAVQFSDWFNGPCADCGHPLSRHDGQIGISCDMPGCECPGYVLPSADSLRTSSRKTAARGFSASYTPSNNDYRAMELVPAAVHPFDGQELLRQIGGGNVMAISGGRRAFVTDVNVGQNVADKETVGLYLPSGQGYGVLIWLDASDTYTVCRVRQGAIKGQQSNVYADQVGEAAYQASSYANVAFGSRTYPALSENYGEGRKVWVEGEVWTGDNMLMDYATNEPIRQATKDEFDQSQDAGEGGVFLSKSSAAIPNLADPPADRSLCEQCREAKATVYAMDTGAGGWGGRYCEACADALKFPIREKLGKLATNDAGGAWFVTDEDGTPLSDDFETEEDARRWLHRDEGDDDSEGEDGEEKENIRYLASLGLVEITQRTAYTVMPRGMDEDWINEQLDAGRTWDEIQDDISATIGDEEYHREKEGSRRTAGQFTDYNTPLPCGCSLANGRCATHAQMMQVIHNAYYSGGMAAKIYALSDGYGEPGYVPEQGRDWSGIRDSSTEAIEAMYAVATGKTASRKVAAVDPELARLARAYWGGFGAESSGVGQGFVSTDGLSYSWVDDATLVCDMDGSRIKFRRSAGPTGWQFKGSGGGWQSLDPGTEEDRQREFNDSQRREDEYRARQKVSDPEGYRRWLGGD